MDDEGETTRVVDEEARVCCDFEGVKSGEDISDAVDVLPVAFSVEDALSRLSFLSFLSCFLFRLILVPLILFGLFRGET